MRFPANEATPVSGVEKQSGPKVIARALKAFVEEHLPQFLLYRQATRRNIVVFASRRSGSTYLARLLSCHRGVRVVDQPFELFYPDTKEGAIKCKHLPSVPLSQFIALSEEEGQVVRGYVSSILRGGMGPLGWIDRWGLPFPASRTVVKITNALALVDWFSENFDVQIVYLLRHPVPQALSVVRNNWGITAQAYLDNVEFTRRYLDAGKMRVANGIMVGGTRFEQAILNWCLENLVPLQHSKSDMLRVSYEELVVRPEQFIPWLAEKLDLVDTSRMLATVRQPAQPRLSTQDTRQAIQAGDRRYLIGRWQDSISTAQIAQAQAILDVFDISEYQGNTPWPSVDLLHFGEPG